MSSRNVVLSCFQIYSLRSWGAEGLGCAEKNLIYHTHPSPPSLPPSLPCPFPVVSQAQMISSGEQREKRKKEQKKKVSLQSEIPRRDEGNRNKERMGARVPPVSQLRATNGTSTRSILTPTGRGEGGLLSSRFYAFPSFVRILPSSFEDSGRKNAYRAA